MTLDELSAAMAAEKKAADALLTKASESDDGVLSDEQQAQFDSHIDRHAKLAATFERAQQAQGLAVQHQTPVEPVIPDQPSDTPKGQIDPAPGTPEPQITGRPRYGQLTAFQDVTVGYGAGRPVTMKAEEAAYRTGRWLQARFLGNGDAARWCSDNGVGMPYEALSIGTATAGGYLVPEEFRNTLIENTDRYGVMRRYAQVVPMTRDTLSVPRVATFITAQAMAEEAAHSATDPAFDQVNLTARKWGCLVQVSSELAEDSPVDLADFLARDFARAFAYAEDDAGFNGDGTSTYHGVYGIRGQMAANESWVGVHTAASGDDTFPEILITDIDEWQAVLPEWALEGDAAIYCSSAFRAAVLQRLANAAGGANLMTMRESIGLVWAGFPVRTSPRMPAGLATDYSEAVMALFGDLSKAVIFGDRREVRMQVLNELYAANDRIGFRATERFDINAHSLGDGTNAGAIVGLMGD